MAEGETFPPGYCHFPQYAEEFFKQLTAERLITRIVKGYPKVSWEKEPGKRNEALDCRVYARAAASIYGIDRFGEQHWKRLEEPVLIHSHQQNLTENKEVTKTRPRGRSGWLGGRGNQWLDR